MENNKPLLLRLVGADGNLILEHRWNADGRFVWNVTEALTLAPNTMLIVEREPSERVETADGVGLKVRWVGLPSTFGR